MKMKARLAGLIETAPWTSEMERCRAILEREMMFPLPVDMLLAYVRERSEREKQAIALKLEFPIARRDVRKWPEMLFMKMFRTALQQSNRDDTVKRRLLFAIIDAIPALTEDTMPALEALLREQETWIEQHGFWTYYWTVYFHPDKEHREALWRSCVETIAALRKRPADEARGLPVPETGDAPANAGEVVRLDKKIQRLEGIYEKETALRQSLEQQLTQKDKLLRQKAGELARLEAMLADARQEAALEKESRLRLAQAALEQESRLRLEQSRWLEEREQYLRQLRAMNDKQLELEQQIVAMRQEAARKDKEKEHWRRTAGDLKQTLSRPEALLPGLERLLHEQIAADNEALLQSFRSSTDALPRDSSDLRRRIRRALDLADALAGYRMSLPAAPEAPNIPNTPNAPDAEAAKAAINAANEETASPRLPAAPDMAGEPVAPHKDKAGSADGPAADSSPGLYGTFYRRDHGGYVTLETGETFNITESMVRRLDLQHEAELLCTPNNEAGKPFRYELQLLFQGDDAYAPIRQFDGYVELGDDGEWYGVDMNDADNRYPLHPRDVEIQSPRHGDPCTFNVAEDGSVARLARLYRVHYGQLDGNGGQSSHPAHKDACRKRKKRPETDAAPQQRGAFLQGCTVAILGGMRKWFEDVVTDCGAELVHDGGEHPERAAPLLKKSQALFLLLTSTSHRATWEGIELAKAHGIPHFVIQGSKSNLRSLLWDNRELIRSSNTSH